jgi:pimeloyl-ACP methyl ester carboxylesterase
MSEPPTPALAEIPIDLPLYVTEVVREHEVPSDPAFLLVHGFGGSSYTWHAWRGALAERGRVLQVDLKGFGKAPKPDDGRYRTTDLAELLVELVRRLDLTRLTLVGHSLGGGLSLMTTLRLLDLGEPRLERLVLVGAAAYPQKLPPFVPLSRLGVVGRLAVDMVGAERIVRGVLRSIVYDSASVTDAQVAAYAAALATPEGVRAAMEVGRSIVPDELDALTRRYPEIDVPVLLLWGRQDSVVPLWVGERLAEELPDARLVVLPECGHLPPEEHPATSLQHLLDFLDETAAR